MEGSRRRVGPVIGSRMGLQSGWRLWGERATIVARQSWRDNRRRPCAADLAGDREARTMDRPGEAQLWRDQQAIERLAQHIPFETNPATKSELIEMLRGIIIRRGSRIDRAVFGFEASQELKRLSLWDRLVGA